MVNLAILIFFLISTLTRNLDASDLFKYYNPCVTVIDYEEYFKNLDNIIIDVKGQSAHFHEFIHKASFEISINTLTTDKLIEILSENDAKVMEEVLETGFKHIKNFKVDLEKIPGPLLDLIPIEFLPKEELATVELETFVSIFLQRLEKGTLKNLFAALPKVPLNFWTNERINSNLKLILNFTAFHFGDTERFVTNQYENGVEAYSSPFKNVLSLILNTESLEILGSTLPIIPMVYAQLTRRLSLLQFILQTFIHVKLDKFVSNIIFDFLGRIMWAIRERRTMFPDESDFLDKLCLSFNKCYSRRIHESESEMVREKLFFSHVPVQYVGIAGALQSLFPDSSAGYSNVDANLLLTVFMMNLPKEVTGACGELTSLIDYLAWNIRCSGTVVKPFSNNSRLIFSFAEAIKTSYGIAHNIEKAFNESQYVKIEDVELMKNLVSENYNFLDFIKGCTDLDFSTVFANAFFSKNSTSYEFLHMETKITGVKRGRESFNSINGPGERINFGYPVTPDRQIEALNSCEVPDVFETPPHLNQSFMRNSQMYPQIDIDKKPMGIPDSQGERIFRDEPDMNPFNRSRALVAYNLNQERCFVVPDISTSMLFAPKDEYIYVDYLMNLRTRGSDNSVPLGGTAKPGELRFIHEFLTAIGESIQDVRMKMKFIIEGSQIGGCGLLKQSFSDFGKLIRASRMKTVQFIGFPVDGFVPVPFLCPKVMGFLGAWTALSLKYEIPLEWNFAPIYLDFLFEKDFPAVALDGLIETIYVDLFNLMRMIYSSGDMSFTDILPRIFKNHRMFDLPEPMKASADPFIMEIRFLELFRRQGGFLASCQRPEKVGKNSEFYLASLKAALKRNILNGKEEYQRYFRHFFKKEFINRIGKELIETFITCKRVEAEDIISRLKYVGARGLPIQVEDDFVDEKGIGGAHRSRLNPEQLMKKIISKLDTNGLEQFLNFVTGSNSLLRDDKKINFTVCAAVENRNYCRSHVCLNNFILIVHENSAQATFEKFLESVNGYCGFAITEFY